MAAVLHRSAPVVCIFVLTACAVNATALALKTGLYPGDEISPELLTVGGFATIVGAVMLIWLILDTIGPARVWAIVGLALLLSATAIWHWVAWPRFWDSFEDHDCLHNCFRAEHVAARREFVGAKWIVATITQAAALCALISVLRRRART